MPVTPETAETLSRRERERLMRRQEILQAARAVFAEKGYTNATVDEIAQRAEFGKGTLYNYFEGGKEDILFAIFDEIYDDLHALIEAHFSSPSTADQPVREAFFAFVQANMSYFLERQELFMIIVKEAYRMIFSANPERATYFKRQSDRMVHALVPTLKRAIERGEIRPLPVHAVAHMIFGNINGLQMHHCLEGQDSVPEDSMLQSPEAAAQFLTTMLFDGLSAK